MPPIPTQALNFSDSDIILAISSLQQREAYLGGNAIKHLATLPPNTTLSEQQRLAEELREDLEDFGKRVEGLEQLIEDLDTEKERQKGREVVLQWASTFAQLKKDARGAVLSSKRAIDQHAKSRRDELFGSAVLKHPTNGKEENESTDDALMRTNASLTDALRRMEARLKDELDRSMLSNQLLTSQTATLRQTSNAHGQLTSLLDTSKNLITALERTDWLDRLLILGALAVFLLTCGWIIKVRVFDRVVGIAFWWVKWMPSWDESSMIDALEKGQNVVSASLKETAFQASSSLSSVVSAFTESATSVISDADWVTTGLPETVETMVASMQDATSVTDNILASGTTTVSEISLSPTSSITSLASSIHATASKVLKDEL
ncbi:hypothetical protein FRC18_010559 [Serendipita sp. 400]|nr:hypothetical protein FRC18_010559 [Serendipita sp. 400]